MVLGQEQRVRHSLRSLLIAGEPNLGVYKYKDKNCVFGSVEAVRDFMNEPEFYLLGVM